jgi:chemotaxis protein CheX
MEQNVLTSVVSSVWSTVFGVEPLPAPAAPGERAGRMARVCIFGEQASVVTVSCSEAVARHVAAEMLALPDALLSADEVDDALGEIANMAAGNLKALLPAGHHLSLPDVSAAGGQPLTGALLDHCALECPAGVLTVTVHGLAPAGVA